MRRAVTHASRQKIKTLERASATPLPSLCYWTMRNRSPLRYCPTTRRPITRNKKKNHESASSQRDPTSRYLSPTLWATRSGWALSLNLIEVQECRHVQALRSRHWQASRQQCSFGGESSRRSGRASSGWSGQGQKIPVTKHFSAMSLLIHTHEL